MHVTDCIYRTIIEIKTNRNELKSSLFIYSVSVFDILHVIKSWRLWQLNKRYCGLIWNAKIRGNKRLIVSYMRDRNHFECTYTHFRSQYNVFFLCEIVASRKREGSFSSSFYDGQNYYVRRNSSSLFPISLSLPFFCRCHVFMLSLSSFYAL